MEEDIVQKIALITASLALLAAPVLAEDAKTTGTAPANAKFATVAKDEMFSSKLKGLNVYNQKDESVGEITDLAINKSFLKCNRTIRKRLPRRKMRINKRLLAFSRRLQDRRRETRYRCNMSCVPPASTSPVSALRSLWEAPFPPGHGGG